MLEYRINCGHKNAEGWCDYCVELWKEAYNKGLKESKTKKKAYMCATDYHYELESRKSPSQIFGSIESLKSHKKCWKDCGIVEIEIYIKRIID